MMELVRFFKALGDETRMAMVSFLLGHEHTVSDFFPDNEKGHAAMTRHLEILLDSGIINSKNNGSETTYSISNESMRRRLVALGITASDDFNASGQEELDIKEVVRSKYSKIANEGGDCRPGGCCGKAKFDPALVSSQIGYSDEEISIAPDANLGLGCGNPIGLGSIHEGETVLDMGSGAGIDSFLAAKKVGDTGRVIGVDMTEDMILKARENAQTYGFQNVEFRWGDIENMPVETSSVDVVLSNCVINLVPDKPSAFREAFRVLKFDGRLYISDIILTDELTAEQRNDRDLICGCVAGAVPKKEYLQMMEDAGFKIQEISEDESIGNEQYEGLPVASLHIKAVKKCA